MERRKKFAGDNDLQLGLFDNLGHLGFTDPDIEKAARQMRINERRQREDFAAAGTALKFISFGSGSSGNSAFIGDDRSGILIDAGIDVDNIEKCLADQGIDIRTVKAVCLTHDHSDHVRYAYTIVRRHSHIGVFCTPRVMNGLLRRHGISNRIKDFHRPIFKEFNFTPAPGFNVTAFDVSHDGIDNAGFFVEHAPSAQNFAIATDLGCITDRVDHYMRLADYIMIESNYDSQMLANGPYTPRLKARILADSGHLDNLVAAQFLARIYTPRLKNVFLCHLSQDNNSPAVALETVAGRLREAGVTPLAVGADVDEVDGLRIVALPRFTPSKLYTLRKKATLR